MEGRGIWVGTKTTRGTILLTKRDRYVILPLLVLLPVLHGWGADGKAASREGGRAGGRLTPVSDRPTGLVTPRRVVPEQLKSGKQNNKQQLLAG